MTGRRRLSVLAGALAQRPLWHLGCGFFAGVTLAAGDLTGAAVGLVLLAVPLVRCRERAPGAARGSPAAFRQAVPRQVAALPGVLVTTVVLAGAVAGAGILHGLKGAPAALERVFPEGTPIHGRVQAVEPGPRGLRLLLSVPGVAGRVAVEWPDGPRDPRRWPLPGDQAAVLPAGVPAAPRAARNPFSFDPRRYWYARHVGILLEARRVTTAPGSWMPQRSVAAWRHQRLHRLRQVLAPDAAGLVEALIFGVRSGIDRSVTDAFRQAGISHLLAVSGLHVGLVAAGTSRLGAWAGLTGAARWAVTAAAAVLYAVLAGAGPPVNRAAVGAVLLAAAPLLSRPADGLNLLGAAACWALLTRPLAALDLSFRLSFMAVAGMLLLGGRLQALLPGGTRTAGLRRALTAGIAAQLTLAPILAASFGDLAWAGAAATVIMVPALALLLGFGGAWALVDAACPACVEPLVPALEGMARVVAWMGQWLARPGAVWSAPAPPGWWVVLYYLWLCGWAGDWRSAAQRLRRREPDAPRRLLMTALGLAALLLWGTAALTPRHLEIVFLDVGQGDAVAVGAPGGAWAAVDTGPRGTELTAFLRARGARRLAWWAVTHGHADHAGGLDLLARTYPQAPLVTPAGGVGLEGETGGGRGTAPRLEAARGDRLRLGPVPIQVLGPPEGADAAGWRDNDRSLVLRIDWAGWRVLLTGDIEAAAEGSLLEGGLALQADVLKVAHHGSDTSTSARWLAEVRPRLAVISVGRRNGYGHPHQPVLQRLRDAGAFVVRTDFHGAVWLRIMPSAIDVTYYGPDGPRRLRLPGPQDRGAGQRRESAWSTTRLSAAWNGVTRHPSTWCPGLKPIWSAPSSTGCGLWPASRPSTFSTSTPPSTACRRCWRPPASCPCSGRGASWWWRPMRGWAAGGGAWARPTWRIWRLTPPIPRPRQRWFSWRPNPTGG